MTDAIEDDVAGTSAGSARLVLLRANDTYWLYEGSEFLNALLFGRGEFPTPVECVNFSDAFQLRIFLNGRPINDFWIINPDIVARLRRNDELIDVAPPRDSGPLAAREAEK